MTEVPFPFRPRQPQAPQPPPRLDPVQAPVRHEVFGLPQAGPADRLFELRTVLVHGHLDHGRVTEVCSRLMTLDALGGAPVRLHLRVPDADLDAAFALVDTLDVLACPVHATAVGEVGGAALAVLASAGRREMTRHATLRLTEPREHFTGNAHELSLHEQNHARLVAAFYHRLADCTGRTPAEIRADANPGRLLTATDALAYGLVHDIAGSPPPGIS